MPKFKTARFQYVNAAGADNTLSVDIHVNSDGMFSAKLPEGLLLAFDQALIAGDRQAKEGWFRAQAQTLNVLESEIRRAHVASMTPEVTEEPVI